MPGPNHWGGWVIWPGMAYGACVDYYQNLLSQCDSYCGGDNDCFNTCQQDYDMNVSDYCR
jgi:hypothetical protein